MFVRKILYLESILNFYFRYFDSSIYLPLFADLNLVFFESYFYFESFRWRQIFAIASLTPSQIGVILCDSHWIAQVNSVSGSKILMMLKAQVHVATGFCFPFYWCFSLGLKDNFINWLLAFPTLIVKLLINGSWYNWLLCYEGCIAGCDSEVTLA